MTQNNRYPMSVSSETQFIPRVREVNGSNDSHHYQRHSENAHSLSSNDQSMTTADMTFYEEDDGMYARRRHGNVDLDLELQAAVDLMLQGSPSPAIRPHRPFYFGRRQIAFAEESPDTLADSAAEPKPSIPQRALQQGRLLYTKVVGGIARRRTARISEESAEPQAEESDGSEAKQQDEYGQGSPIEKPQGKCTKCMPCEPQPDMAPSRTTRMLAPLLRYMQRRPMATLGIVLGALVALLIVIVIILVVGVLPFLIRSTLQDVSFSVTSFHAIAPAPVSRELSLKKLSTSLPFAGSHNPRLDKEAESTPLSAVSIDSEVRRLHKRESLPLTLHSSTPVQTSIAKSVVASKNDARLIATSNGHLRATNTALHATNAIRSQPSHTAVSGNRLAGHVEDVVTATHTSVSIIHLVPNRATPVQNSSVTRPTNIDKAHDAEVLPMTYTMQVAGNLTSGGPIGIDIEFTEPLRMYWRDTEVGTIEKPESINVPGRGTAQWNWPPFEVSIPHAPLIAPTATGNKKLVIPHNASGKNPRPDPPTMITFGPDRVADAAGNAIAQRSVLGGNADLGRAATEEGNAGSQDGLSDWFAAIQAHRSFTMQWKSHVRVSAMGIHTNNVKFEKTVHIVCGITKDCVISA
ncbi:hypothetical protein H4R24_003539 [Coemansia sp. RSA 988]|nr:hypothetical protein H4R24_003539 [Coemansia sp. RSA 988]